jgi:hypothetical protein
MSNNTIIRDAIEKVEEMSAPTTFEIGGKTYCTESLVEIKPDIETPSQVKLYSLDGVVKMISREAAKLPSPLFIQVTAHDQVKVFSTYGDLRFTRCELCLAIASGLPSSISDHWMDYEKAMITLRSLCEQNEGTAYLLDLLSKVTDEAKVETEDNGLSQTVQVRKGVAMVGREAVKPRVALRPFRTFLEVEQPASEFLVRVREGGEIGLFEADGGMWKLKARETIRDYFMKELAPMVEAGEVVVMI